MALIDYYNYGQGPERPISTFQPQGFAGATGPVPVSGLGETVFNFAPSRTTPENVQGRVSDFQAYPADLNLYGQPGYNEALSYAQAGLTLGEGAFGLVNQYYDGELTAGIKSGIENVTGLDPEYLNKLISEHGGSSAAQTFNTTIDDLRDFVGLSPYQEFGTAAETGLQADLASGGFEGGIGTAGFADVNIAETGSGGLGYGSGGFGAGTDIGSSFQGAGAGMVAGFLGSTAGTAVFGEGQGTAIGGTLGGIAGSYFGPPGQFIGSFIGSGIGSLFGRSGTAAIKDETVRGLIKTSGGEFTTDTFSTYGEDRFTEGSSAIANNTAKKINVILATIGGKIKTGEEGPSEVWSPAASESSIKAGNRANLFSGGGGLPTAQPNWGTPEAAIDMLGIHSLQRAVAEGYMDAPEKFQNIITDFATGDHGGTLSDLYRNLLVAVDEENLPGAMARSAARVFKYSFADYQSQPAPEFLTEKYATGRIGHVDPSGTLVREGDIGGRVDLEQALAFDPDYKGRFGQEFKERQVENPNYVRPNLAYEDFAKLMLEKTNPGVTGLDQALDALLTGTA